MTKYKTFAEIESDPLVEKCDKDHLYFQRIESETLVIQGEQVTTPSVRTTISQSPNGDILINTISEDGPKWTHIGTLLSPDQEYILLNWLVLREE
jgi:hypothetical protein